MARRVTAVAAPVAHLVGPGMLRVVNGQLSFATEGGGSLRLRPEELRTVLCYGDVGATGSALGLLFRHEVGVAWLTPGGMRCAGRVVRSDPSRARLRILQHRALADGEFVLGWARSVVAGKARSQLSAARHYQRHGRLSSVQVLGRLRQAEQSARVAGSVEEVLGIGGSSSAAWFGLVGELLGAGWHFPGRARRPPPDPVNALLSLGYTWLLARVVARAEAAGLEVGLGGLHAYHPGRPSLACDLMEALRVPAVDRWVVGVCNQGLLGGGDFREAEEGGIRLGAGVFGRVLGMWEKYWSEQGVDGMVEEEVENFLRQVRRHDREATPEEFLGNAGE